MHTMLTLHPFSGWETQIEQPESQKSLRSLRHRVVARPGLSHPLHPEAEMHKRCNHVQPFFVIPELTPTVAQFEKAFQDISSKASCRFLNLHILKHILSYCQEHVAAFSSKAIKFAEVSDFV